MKEKSPRSPNEALDEVTRELNVRTKCYDRWVSEGKMTQTEAQNRFDGMVTAAVILKTMIAGLPRSEAEKPLDRFSPAE